MGKQQGVNGKDEKENGKNEKRSLIARPDPRTNVKYISPMKLDAQLALMWKIILEDDPCTFKIVIH